MFSCPVKALAEDNTTYSVNEEQRVENLYQYISNMKNQFEILKDVDVKEFVESFIKTGNDGVTSSKIYKAVITYFFKELVASAKLMVLVVVIAILAALINNLQSAFSNEKLSNIAYFACYSILIITVSKSFLVGLDLVKDTIRQISDFMMAILPVLIMLIASVGGISEAAVMNPIIVAGVSLGSRLYVTLILPMILMAFVLQFVNNITEDYKVDRLTKLINQYAIWAQGILMTIFVGVVSIRGMTSKTLDVVTAKTAKYAVDNFIPIIGKCLSDAISTVAGYSLLLKNALSALGLIVIIAIVAFPIIKIFVMAMLYRFTAAMLEPISDKRIINCISSAGDSLILVMTCLLSVSIMFFIMISMLASSGKVLMGG